MYSNAMPQGMEGGTYSRTIYVPGTEMYVIPQPPVRAISANRPPDATHTTTTTIQTTIQPIPMQLGPVPTVQQPLLSATSERGRVMSFDPNFPNATADGFNKVVRQTRQSPSRDDVRRTANNIEEELRREREQNRVLLAKMQKLREELDLYHNEERESLITYYERRLDELKAGIEKAGGMDDGQRLALEAEIRRVNEEKNGVITRLENELQLLRGELVKYQRDARAPELERQVRTLTETLERERMNNRGAEEVDRWKTKFLMLAFEVDRLVRVLNELSGEVGNWIVKYEGLEGSTKGELTRIRNELEQARARVGIKPEEYAFIEQKMLQAERRIRELEDENGRLRRDLDMEMHQKTSLHDKIASLTADLSRVGDREMSLENLRTEREVLMRQISKLAENNSDRTFDFLLISFELDRMLSIMREKDREYEGLYQKLAERPQVDPNEKALLEQQMRGLRQRIAEQDALIQRLEDDRNRSVVDVETLKRSLVDKQQEMDNYKLRLSSVNVNEDALRQLRRELDTTLMDKKDLERRITEVLSENRQLLNESAEIRRRYDDVVARLSTIENSNNDAGVLRNDNNTLRTRIAMLEREIDKLTTSLNDALGSVSTIQKQNDINRQNYDATIRELRFKLEEQQGSGLETERLRMELMNARRANEELNARISSMQMGNDNQRLLESVARDLRQRVEDGLVAHILLGSENLRLVQDMSGYRSENEALRLRVGDQREVTDARNRAMDLEEQMRKLSQRLLEAETKARMSNGDSERVVILMKERDELLAQQRGIVSEREESRAQIELLRRAMAERDAEIRDLKFRFEQERGAEMNQLRTRNSDLEQKLQSLRTEFEQLQRLSTQREEEWRRELENMRILSIDSSEMAVKFKAERTALETQIMQLRSKLSEFENKLQVSGAEIDKLSALLNERTGEVERLRMRNRELETGYFQELEELRLQLEAYKRNNLDARELSLKFGGEKSQLDTQIRQLRKICETSKLEAEKLSDLITQVRLENDDLKRECDALRRDMFSVSNERNTLENEYKAAYDKLQSMQRELDKAVQAKNALQQQLEVEGSQLSRKNQELISKIGEIDNLQKRYEDALRDPSPNRMRYSQSIPTRNSTYGGGTNPNYGM